MADDDDEAPELAPALPPPPPLVPLTILTGYLGSGKSTIVNRLLHSPSHGLRIMVIENEFADGVGPDVQGGGTRAGIEGMLVRSDPTSDSSFSDFSSAKPQDYSILELPNGCVCCSVKSQLLSAIESALTLALRPPSSSSTTSSPRPFDHVIIETSGLSNPGPLIDAFWGEGNAGDLVRLDGVVAVVDCKNFEAVRDAYEQALGGEGTGDGGEELLLQLLYADRVLLNKLDACSDDGAEKRIETIVRQVNPKADVVRCVRGRRLPPGISPLSPSALEMSNSPWCLSDVSLLLNVNGYISRGLDDSLDSGMAAAETNVKMSVDDVSASATTTMTQLTALCLPCDAGGESEDSCRDDYSSSVSDLHPLPPIAPPARISSLGKKTRHSPGISTVSVFLSGSCDIERMRCFIADLLWAPEPSAASAEALEEEDGEEEETDGARAVESAIAIGISIGAARSAKTLVPSLDLATADGYRPEKSVLLADKRSSAAPPRPSLFAASRVYRVKGVLSIGCLEGSRSEEYYEGYDVDSYTGVIRSPKRFLLQGVNDTFDIMEGGGNLDWKAGEERCVKVVFIGTKLDEQQLRDGVLNCMI